VNQHQDYPRSDLLAETDWVAEHAQDAGVRLVDCAAVEAYRRAHIPGAVGFPPLNPYIKDRSDDVYVMPADQFAELMARLGIGDDTLVVCYDDNNSLLAARLWWVLQYYGHHNARVLNGGWYKWLYEGRPVTTHATHPEPAVFTPKADDSVLCRLGQLAERIGTPSAQILDVRSEEEFAGTNSRGNRRVGHVPGAAHIEWTDFVTRDDRRVFKPASEIHAMLDGAGIEPAREVVTYCQGGIRAAHAMFVLKLMGFDQVRNYDGSMKEWANRDDTALELPA
jgi:thiosulfate/3-mercaptopyruvate sulfurtransferase